MTTIQIDIPDPLARNAKDAGLLEPKAMEAILRDELIRRRAVGELLDAASRVSSGEGSLSDEHVRAAVEEEIDRYRAEKRDPREGRR
jgi:hypothetical protein